MTRRASDDRRVARNILLWGSFLVSFFGANRAFGQAAHDSSAYEYSKPIEPSFVDVPYASQSASESLDLYLPAEKKGPAPLIIWIHGGAFRVGDKRSMPRRDFRPPPNPEPSGHFQVQVPDVAALTAKGYAVASINYRLLAKPGDAFEQYATPAVQDAKAAVRYLRANAAKYNLASDKFAVWGNSGGGYMAAMLGVTGDQSTVFDDPSLGNAGVSSAVQAVIVWYGAIEVEQFPPQARISHYIATAKVIPPFLIAHGDMDSMVPTDFSRRLNAELLAAGRKSTLRIVTGAGHEDPLFMETEMRPTFAFIDSVFGR